MASQFTFARTGNALVDKNFDALAAALNPALQQLAKLATSCFAYATTNTAQSLSADVWTAIFWTATGYDTDGAISGTKFTVPAKKGGRYQVSGRASISAGSGEVIAGLYVNGQERLRGSRHAYDPTGATGVLVAGDLLLNPGDYVELRAYSTAGASLETPGTMGTWMTAHKIPST